MVLAAPGRLLRPNVTPDLIGGGGGSDALQTFIDEMSVNTVRKHNNNLITDSGIGPALTKEVWDYDFITNGAGANNAWADDAAVAVEMGAAQKYMLTDANAAVWVPWLKRSYAVGGGGHNNYGGNEGYYYDWLTGLWTRANDPCPYVANGHPTLAADPSQLTTPTGTPDWYPWPRSDGVRGPYSCHTYGSVVPIEADNTLWVFGASTFGPNPGPPGGTVFWDLDTDDWQQTGAVASSLSWLNGRAVYLPNTNEIWTQAGTQTGYAVDCSSGFTWSQRSRKFGGNNPSLSASIMTRPDRGDTDYTEAFSINSVTTSLIVWPLIDDQVGTWNGGTHDSFVQTLTGTAPAGLLAQDGYDYCPDSDIVYHWPGGATLNRIDMGTSAWISSVTLTQHASAADIPATSLFSAPNPCGMKFDYIPEYSTASYAIFFAIEDTDAADGNVFVMKVGL